MKYFTLLLVLFACGSSLYSQWQIQTSGTTENLNDVEIIDRVSGTTAIAVGNNGIILKTTNSGNDWVSQNSGTTNNLIAVSLYNTYGAAVGDNIICSTTDEGDTWSTVNTNKLAICVIYYWSGHFGPDIIVGCSDGTLLYSTDIGLNWNDTLMIIEPIVAIGFFLVYPPNGPEILTFSSNSYTAYTVFPINQSSIWNIYTNPTGFGDTLTSGEMSGFNYLIGWGGNPGPIPFLLKKDNLDTIWTRVELSQLLFQPNDITVFSYHGLFICGNNGKIYVSTDDGYNWFEQISGINDDLNSIKFSFIDPTGYAVGDNGVILFTSNGGGINSVEEIIKPDKIVLDQNYPNPFNPATNIRYKLNDRQFVKLKVYDVLGNEIISLVNEEQTAGNYVVEFNPLMINSMLSSGIYLYKFSATGKEGHFVKTRKMIYIK
jgi:photosystem II stability/assembly factor-like uncharacterized protein